MILRTMCISRNTERRVFSRKIPGVFRGEFAVNKVYDASEQLLKR